MEASSPAKIILFGEHAVVYNQPAIAAPVSSLRVTASAQMTDTGNLRVIASDLNEILPIDLLAIDVNNALQLTVKLVLDHIEKSPPSADIIVKSTIPFASGLGSGAAVSSAIARALLLALDETLSDGELNDIVYEVEKIHHGTPSGIDNAVVVHERPIYYVRSKPIEFLKPRKPIYLIIGDTGVSAPTRISVSDVRKRFEQYPIATRKIVDSIGAIAKRANAALTNGDTATLGKLMNENHHLLGELTVSSPELDELTNAARKAGALGAKLSGGGRGGNMIALITPEMRDSVRRAIEDAGAVRTFSTEIG